MIGKIQVIYFPHEAILSTNGLFLAYTFFFFFHCKHQNIIIATLGRRAEAVTGKGHMEGASGDIGEALFLFFYFFYFLNIFIEV